MRFRLTALYCCLFFPSGVALVAITYVLIVLTQNQKAIGHLKTVGHLDQKNSADEK